MDQAETADSRWSSQFGNIPNPVRFLAHADPGPRVHAQPQSQISNKYQD
jgi:hypothetical protein